MARALLISQPMKFVYAGLLAVMLSLGACAKQTNDQSGPDADVAAAVDAGAPGAFMSQCTEDSECETNLCFPFNSKGPHCTHECTVDEDCADPSPGCNNKGVCKAP